MLQFLFDMLLLNGGVSAVITILIISVGFFGIC